MDVVCVALTGSAAESTVCRRRQLPVSALLLIQLKLPL